MLYDYITNPNGNYAIPPIYHESSLSDNSISFISKRNIKQFNKQIITDLSPKKKYFCFVKEFDSTKEIDVVQSPSMIKLYDSSFKFANNQIISAGINLDEIYKTVNTYGNSYVIPVGVITTSYTKERNILKFRNYHPIDTNSWSIGIFKYIFMLIMI